MSTTLHSKKEMIEINEQTTTKVEYPKIRIATADRCVMCGEIIPEGQQVCGLCKYKIELE